MRNYEGMKKIYLFILFFGISTLLLAQDTIRIMTLNIHHGADNSLQTIGEFIKQYHPDLVALQELDQWPERSEAPKQKGKNFIAELSYYADMMGYFGKAFDHPSGWDYGDGILSKYAVNKVENIILPYKSKAEPRQIIITHLNIKGHPICFASTHLAHENKENRELQLKKVRSIMRKQKEKIKFVCGDFNADYKEDIVLKIMRGWSDALPEGINTFPSYTNATYKYDYILYETNRNIIVINNEVDCVKSITDHCAGITDVIIY